MNERRGISMDEVLPGLRDESTIFFTDIRVRTGGEMGNEYSWRCPLCKNKRLPYDLHISFVTTFALDHLRKKHNVELDIDFVAVDANG